ncbi:hypothetical protein DM860_015117 [Cuscuta australis]|uniref:RNase H type-1 domain-containing protein n=1 Tax=Cuscuta australis TaxID=267555 RepID=A0A328DBM1_9ASTE|nr:hypothetical protein DM860_015117 [Cuscuta australis]
MVGTPVGVTGSSRSRPRDGFVKVNIDASTRLVDDMMGVGFIARNDLGVFLAAKNKSFRGSYGPKEAEAVAVKEALSWIKSKGWMQVAARRLPVIVESQSSSQKSCKRNRQPSRSKESAAILLQGIGKSLRSFSSVLDEPYGGPPSPRRFLRRTTASTSKFCLRQMEHQTQQSIGASSQSTANTNVITSEAVVPDQGTVLEVVKLLQLAWDVNENSMDQDWYYSPEKS